MSGTQNTGNENTEVAKPKTVSLLRFKTDRTKEVEGVWVDVGGGLRFKVARMGNPQYEQYLMKRGRFFGRGMRLIEGDNIDAVQGYLKDAIAEHILLGWDGLTEEDEITPIPFSKKRARALLDEYPEFYRLVNEFANDLEHYRAEAREVAAGN